MFIIEASSSIVHMPRRTWNIKAPLKQKHFIYEAGVIVTHKARWRKKSGAQLTQKLFLCRFSHVAQNFAAAFGGKSIFRERQSCCRSCWWCHERREKGDYDCEKLSHSGACDRCSNDGKLILYRYHSRIELFFELHRMTARSKKRKVNRDANMKRQLFPPFAIVGWRWWWSRSDCAKRFLLC